ncbi:MAG: hypothetical protein ACK4ND_15270 [Cytophagaceae bacterium]
MSNYLLIFLLFLLIGCQEHSTDQDWVAQSDLFNFPGIPFSKAEAFSIQNREPKNHNKFFLYDSYSEGFSFIDSSGHLIHDKVIKRSLDSNDIKILNEAINQPYRKSREVGECIPTFREAIIFYNESNEPIAFMNICFECNVLIAKPKINCLLDKNGVSQLKLLFNNLGK